LLSIISVNLDRASLSTERGVELEALFDLAQGVDSLARDHEGTKSFLQGRALCANNCMYSVSFPELVGLDIQDILIHGDILADLQ